MSNRTPEPKGGWRDLLARLRRNPPSKSTMVEQVEAARAIIPEPNSDWVRGPLRSADGKPVPGIAHYTERFKGHAGERRISGEMQLFLRRWNAEKHPETLEEALVHPFVRWHWEENPIDGNWYAQAYIDNIYSLQAIAAVKDPSTKDKLGAQYLAR